MRSKTALVLFTAVLFSCTATTTAETTKPGPPPIAGTWKLLTGTLIEKGDTTVTDYTKNTSFIKIINDTHFAFLQHDLNGGKDSAIFSSGGGRYTINHSTYTEHLEYCTAREWEGHDFTFTVSITNDTLVQQGVEKVESAGIERENKEVYVRLKTDFRGRAWGFEKVRFDVKREKRDYGFRNPSHISPFTFHDKAWAFKKV